MSKIRNKKGKFARSHKRSAFFSTLNKSRKRCKDDIDVANHDHKYCDLTEVSAEVELDHNMHNEVDESWRQGRRIVEFETLANRMFCGVCNCRLHLCDTIGERRSGLGSILYIKCSNQECQTTTDVPTGKMNSSGSFDINDKITIGMIHAGHGYAQMRNFLSECNLPVMSKSCVQRHEKKLGKVFSKLAEESCSLARVEEKELSLDKELEVSFDGGWQKRGTGFNYNSLTGHASLIGKETGKVLGFDVRSKSCATCELHNAKNRIPPEHECHKIWIGSSKSMEPDLAVNLLHEMEDVGCAVDIIHADNDSTTMNRLKIDFKNLKKKDDQNHIKKGITKSLIAYSKKHKELSISDVVPYLTRCFMYAITGNQNEPMKIEEALSRIVPDVFGDHSLCIGTDWCTYKDNPEIFRYKSLPGGKALTNQALRKDLEDLVSRYIQRSSSLIQLGSTQSNESFNQIVSTKAPKSRHYGGSQSLKSRLSAAVLQKNEGYGYLEKMNKAAMLSPGTLTTNISKKLDIDREKIRARNKTINHKKKRIQKKKARYACERRSFVHEGTTYESNIELADSVDDENIPSPLIMDGTESYVVFDLETTGLDPIRSDITQIAAIYGKTEYSSYVFPRCTINQKASEITNITCSLSTNRMFHAGHEVEAKSPKEALLDLIEFLRKIPNPVLIGHNIANFDMNILTYRLKEFSLYSTFCEIVKGFIDTLIMARKIFPKTDVKNYKQSTLVECYLNGMTNEAHSAIEDVRALQKLFMEKMYSQCEKDDFFCINYCACRSSYQTLIKAKTVPREPCMKLAKRGISLLHLKKASERDPKGIKYLFQEYKISSKSVAAFQSFFSNEQ